jgi:CubicO group peptidase (beta-lactamase class C family)
MRTWSSIALVASTILACGISSAQAPEPVRSLTPEQTQAQAQTLTSADIESWLDGFLPYALRQGDIAGGVVVVVQDGEVLLQKGYGHADLAAGMPVTPDRTLFRVGSIAKLVTWSAVMQLVEQGRLDLDRDINDYLDFEIPPAFDRPITLRNLMTHTPGFEELFSRILVAEPAQFLPLEAYVKAATPTRIYPPGEMPAYSNYGVALAGYIVQRVSGESFDHYVERHVMRPLGMQSATFRQPLPAQFAGRMSRGYKLGSDPPHYFELVGPAPAGSLSATGADMARFMIAQLQAREGTAPSLMEPATARLMHETLFSAAPPTNGMALGFFERSLNGRRIIGHGGDTQFFHSDLLLFIDDGVGLFMAFNSTGRESSAHRIREALLERFADRYFPAPPSSEPTSASTPVDAMVSAGRYQSSRRADTSFLAVLSVLGQTSVVVNPDGTMVIPPLTGLNGKPKVWRKVGTLVWREVGGRERLAARIVDGNVRLLGIDSAGGIDMLQPVPAWKSSAWILPALLASMIVLLIAVLSWPVLALVRKRYGATSPVTGRAALVHRLARVAALAHLVFLAGWFALLQVVDADFSVSGGAIDPWLALLHALGMLAVVGTGVAIWNAWLTWRRGAPWHGRASSLLLSASCVVVSGFAIAFNLIRFTIAY